jgi:hypothetical protein
MVPGEMRVYTTTIAAEDRRESLMQDRLYRLQVVAAAMGYYQVPMASYDLRSAPLTPSMRRACFGPFVTTGDHGVIDGWKTVTVRNAYAHATVQTCRRHTF